MGNSQSELFDAIVEGRAVVKAKVQETETGFHATVDQWGVKAEADGMTSSSAQNKAIGQFVNSVKQGKYKLSRF